MIIQCLTCTAVLSFHTRALLKAALRVTSRFQCLVYSDLDPWRPCPQRAARTGLARLAAVSWEHSASQAVLRTCCQIFLLLSRHHLPLMGKELSFLSSHQHPAAKGPLCPALSVPQRWCGKDELNRGLGTLNAGKSLLSWKNFRYDYTFYCIQKSQ